MQQMADCRFPDGAENVETNLDHIQENCQICMEACFRQ